LRSSTAIARNDPELQRSLTEPGEYWVARSSRATTIVGVLRPCLKVRLDDQNAGWVLVSL